MPEYRVRLRRITYAEVLVEASTAKDARQMVGVDPHQYFVTSNTIDTDTTIVVSVKVEQQ